jgi:signal transduction histidine kinase
VATYAGLARLPKGSAADPAEFVRYRHDPDDPNSLSSDQVTSLAQDDSGILWIGTAAGGLNRLDPRRGTFRAFRRKDGLPSDKVAAMVVDEDGRLWVSTANGLSRFDPRTGEFRNYDSGDGLHGDVFLIGAAHRSPRGEIFFGGSGGLTSFFPDRITDDPQPPAVVITEFLILNEPVAVHRKDPESPLHRSMVSTTELTLTHRHRVVGFEFAALHYADPTRNRYAYQLEGFDEQWIETGADKRFAQYTNLDPGEYVFRVKATNKDGVWNETGAAVRIRVLPPPWRTWWAYSIYGLAVAAAVTVFVRRQRREVRREREINRRLREVDRLKDEFLANTSHELRTPLFGIIGLTQTLLAEGSSGMAETAKERLEMIAASGHRLTAVVSNLLDVSRLREGGISLRRREVGLSALVEEALNWCRPEVGDKDLALSNAVPADLPAVEADPQRIQQVLVNLIGNAVKFTAAGRVEVSAEVVDHQVEVRVEDTGPGIPEAQRQRIFDAFEQVDGSTERAYKGVGLGLAVSRRLVELHGGEIRVDSEMGGGSTFIFTLPQREPHSIANCRPRAS